jgi:hypothetical protein
MSIGARVAAPFDAVLGLKLLGGVPYANDPAWSEEMVSATLGLRWFPLGRTRVSRWGQVRHAWLYGQADLGYASLERWRGDGDSSVVGRGITAGARLGWIGVQGRDWTLGLEVHDQLALLNGDEGLRHSFGVQFALQLFTPPDSYRLPW